MPPLRPRRPSPAMVVALLALFIALGGASYAAIKIPDNSVGAAQLKTNAVVSTKLNSGAVTAKAIRKASTMRRTGQTPQTQLFLLPRNIRHPLSWLSLSLTSRADITAMPSGL